MKEKNRKALGYSSQMAFVISLIAGSVGTGNIWRFPRVAAQNGGAFILAYLVVMFFIIMPVMMGEHVIGRVTRHGAPGAYRDFVGRNKTWLGMIIVCIMAMTASYYSAVLGWIMYYIVLSFTGGYFGVDKLALFDSISNGNPITVLFFVMMLAISAFIAYKGVNGIEKANKVFIPVLFVCLIVLSVRSLTLPGATEGLDYMFGFEFRDLLNYKPWLEALTQAVWSAGPGWGLCITLAVFSNPRSDVALTSAVNGFGDTFAATLAGLAVIPAIFVFASTPEEALSIAASGNNGLTFLSMTSIFESMTGGQLLGVLFFISLMMAGLSSNVCHFMIIALPFADAGVSKKKSILGIFFVLLIWGLPSAWNATFLSNQDWVAGQMMIVGVFLSCYALIKFGVGKVRTVYLNNKYTGLRIGKWWEYSIKFLVPIFIGIVFIWLCIGSLSSGDNWWTPFSSYNLGTFIFQGALMAIICFIFNNKCADSIKNKYMKDDGLFPEVPENGFSG